MTTIKKDFVAIVELLEANQNKKVSSILPQLLELCTKKNNGGSDIGKTFIKNDNDEVVAVYCYYHKKWEVVAEVPYGKKAGTSTGLNTMCKEGVSNWTKAQRKAKQAESDLLTKLASGDLEVTQLADAKADIEAMKAKVVARSDEHGFATADEVIAYLTK